MLDTSCTYILRIKAKVLFFINVMLFFKFQVFFKTLPVAENAHQIFDYQRFLLSHC